jgi:uncharacterized protein
MTARTVKEKKHFFIRLIPPRPGFSSDMTPEERGLMQQHVAYWQGLLRRKIAFAFGPVFDPRGGYGIGIVELADEKAAEELMAKDPTLLSGTGFSFEIYGMRLVKK